MFKDGLINLIEIKESFSANRNKLKSLNSFKSDYQIDKKMIITNCDEISKIDDLYIYIVPVSTI